MKTKTWFENKLEEFKDDPTFIFECAMLELAEKLIREGKYIYTPDPELIKLADELTEGIE